ncbi:MAG: secretin N-terminal domain-containing protein [Atribacterota bacterium]
MDVSLTVLFLLAFVAPLYGATLKDLFWRADHGEIKLTFKFNAPVKWKDVSPDEYHLALEVEGAHSGLPYAERSMTVGPLQKIIFTERELKLVIWVELDRPTTYEAYDEAGGRLVSVILKGPFETRPKKQNLYSFDFYDTEVRDAIVALAKVAGVNVVVDDSVEGKITASFENLTFDQALGYILTIRGLGQVKLGNNIIVARKEKLDESFGLFEVRRFPLKSIAPEKAREILNLVVPAERVAVDEGSRALVIRGKEEEFNQIVEILNKIDVALKTQTFYLSNNIYEDEAQLQKIRELLRIVVHEEERVNYDFMQKAFIVRGTEEEIKACEELLVNLDRKLPQIMIEAKLIEINREKVKDLGVTWTSGGKEGQIAFGELTLGGSMERQELMEVTLKALEKRNLARLVGNPRILTLSGKTATIHVGDSIPFRNLRTDEEGRILPGELQFLDVGITLEVTPILTSEGTVVVHVKPEVSTYTEREYVLAGLAFKDPQTSIKNADTTARLHPGETLVIGGLIRSEDIENITRIPILSEIPLIGSLFTLRSKTHKETELVVFLTPHLIGY